jgi:hypothetical protein
MQLPKSPTKVMELITDFADEKRAQLCRDIKHRIETGERYSITADEWTSTANKRYMNVNLHGQKGFTASLGLVRIQGTFTSERTLEAVKEQLHVFGVDMEKHCVASVTDGAAVMVKYGRISPSEFQACYTHAIHLAVCDMLYKNSEDAQVAVEVVESVEADVIDNVDVHDEDEIEIDEDIQENENYVDASEGNRNVHFKPTIKTVMGNVRKDVKKFRKSSKQNETLQKYVAEEHGTELKLILDVKTRWNSLQSMLTRYVKLRSCIKKTFIDCGAQSAVSDDEFVTVQQLASILEPVKVTSDALCRDDATLISADGALKFLFMKLGDLGSQSNVFSEQLLESLKERIEARRNIPVTSLLHYLHNPEGYNASRTSLGDFPKASRASIHKLAIGLFNRLSFRDPCEGESQSAAMQDEDDEDHEVEMLDMPEENLPTASVSLQEQLQKYIDDSLEVTLPDTNLTSLSLEFKVLENQKKRTANLEHLYQALLTIKPSSVEAERIFSIAGNFATKIRSRLSDRSLCALVFLKKYFLMCDNL